MIPITLDHVTKRFGESRALDGIDLQIAAGEIFFLLGPSGCGKTTLLRTVAGFYIPEEGRVRFGDEDVTQLEPHRRNTGMMFQSYALWPHMNVAKNVAFGLEERRVKTVEVNQRVKEALAAVQMEPYAERRIHQLSGGQQQRVALARALVIRPRCLLLDEPLSNLDTKLRTEMRTEIRRICREAGLTAVYVTHDQKEALSIADRMAVLDRGRIRQVGTPGELYRQPKSRFVADFMGETNFLEGTVGASDPGAVSVDTALGRFQAATRDTLQTGSRVVLSIRPESWRLGTRANGMNSVTGRLDERIYLGEVAQYRFRPDAATVGEPLKIIELNPRFVEADANAALFAHVDPEDVVVLPHGQH